MSWNQSEHVCLIGDTGSGKSFLMEQLLAHRRYCVVIQTKPDDIPWTGYRRIGSLDARRPTRTRYLYTPPRKDRGANVEAAMEQLYDEGGWTVGIDELFYCDSKLGCTDSIEELFTQGRSKNLTVVAGLQRPVGVTRWAMSQSHHVYCFEQEPRDIKTVCEATSESMKLPLLNLRAERYEFVKFNRRDKRHPVVGSAQSLDRILAAA